MTRHPLRHLLLLIVAGPVLAACAASTAPPTKPVTRQVTTQPGQAYQVQVPPGTTYVARPAADPNTTYVVKVHSDFSALQDTHAALVRAQQELAATRQALAKRT